MIKPYGHRILCLGFRKNNGKGRRSTASPLKPGGALSFSSLFLGSSQGRFAELFSEADLSLGFP
jgi:hypothetical protein